MAKSFADLPIVETIQAAIRAEGYTIPTPIQAAAIPPLLEGRDLLGCAQTGTGKTAAFAIPILQLLAATPQKATPHYPRALILAPTRELAVQITESFDTYGKGLKLRCTSVFGGVGQASQVNAMKRGVHVLVATPGRLLDLMEQGQIYLDRLSYFVLDEADRMLDMGFMPSLKRIVRALPKKRQSIFLSATMPPPIEELASQLLHEHVSVMVTPPATTAQRVTQRVMFVEKDDKRYLLEKLLEENALSKVLVFTRTKHGADRLCKQLRVSGLAIDAIHGNKSQGARQRVLGELKNGKLRVLVATDVAARGIDVDAISHVINYEIPTDPESYVHRIGRTARAGETGESISFCDVDEVPSLRDIEKQIGQSIPIDRDQPYHSDGAERGSARGPKGPRARGSRDGAARGRATGDRGSRRQSQSRSDFRGAKKTATSFAGNGNASESRASESRASESRASESRASEGQTEAPRRKRSISGKVKKVKTDARKSYGFAHAKPKSPGKKRPPR